MANEARELSEAAIAHQVDQLEDYLRRGGSQARWFDSKDLAPEDADAIRTERERRARRATA